MSVFLIAVGIVFFIDKPKRRIYIFPLPCLGIMIQRRPYKPREPRLPLSGSETFPAADHPPIDESLLPPIPENLR